MQCPRALSLFALALSLTACAGYKSREVGRIPDPSEASDISGRYSFSSLEDNCTVSGSRSVLRRTKDHSHYSDVECSRFDKSKDFLPLPLEGWAHPRTTMTVEVRDTGFVVILLYPDKGENQKVAYDTLSFPRDLSREQVDAAQIPFSGGSAALEWSMSRNDQGLLFELEDTEKGVFFLLPTHRKFKMTCLLPEAEDAS